MKETSPDSLNDRPSENHNFRLSVVTSFGQDEFEASQELNGEQQETGTNVNTVNGNNQNKNKDFKIKKLQKTPSN